MYGKIFRQMYKGTLASAGPWQALVTFQQLIVLADVDGIVDMTADAIARETTIPLEVINAGLQALEKPDPESRTPDEEGRRIVRLSDDRTWGWRITNYKYYRELKREEDRREYHRQYWHKRKTQQKTQQLNKNSTLSTYAEAEAEEDVKEDQKKDMSGRERPDPVFEVFDHWRKVWNHPKAQLDAKRRKVIAEAIRIGYSPSDLCDAVSGYRASPHHRGENDRQTTYDSIDLLLRDAKHIDAGLGFTRGPVPQTSELTRHNIAVLSQWAPPETQDAPGRPKQIPSGDGEHGGGVREGSLSGAG